MKAFSILLVCLMSMVCFLTAASDGSETPESARRARVYTKADPPRVPTLEELPLEERITQHGITWTFEQAVRVGRFVNGDYYVVGSVTITQIDPKPLWGDEVGEIIDKSSVRESRYPGRQARNGSVLNVPSRSKKGGYDSRIPSGRYDPDLFAHLPIRMKPGDVLVSTVSRKNEEIRKFSGQHVDPLQVAAALTCVAEPQPPDAFRPSYCDSAHSKIYLARNLRRDLLLSLTRPTSAPETLDEYARSFQKPWLDSVDFGFAAPVDNLPHYGQSIAQLVGEASLLLMMDYSADDKERLLVNSVQVGIDLWGVARGGFVWQGHGGLNSGRKWPMVLSGILLDDKEMQSPTKAVPGLRFGEDDQTALCPYAYKGKTFESGWTGAKAVFVGHSPYLMARSTHWADGWGPVDLFHPSEWPDDKLTPKRLPASEGYRRANTSGAWIGQALAARLMHVEDVWNHDAFFAYVDRWMTEDDAPFVEEIKKAGGPDYTGVERGRFGRQSHVWGPKFVRQMWETYRNNLPPAPDGHQAPPAEVTWK